jgi:hypothetical protein
MRLGLFSVVVVGGKIIVGVVFITSVNYKMWNLSKEQKDRYDVLHRKIHSVDGYNTPPTTEEVKEFEKLVQITRKGGRRPSKKRSARRRRSSKARKSRKSRATRRK